jgi:ferredoxin
MPKLTVEGVGTFEIAPGKRLVKAMVEDAGTDQLHACGGFSRCTTCRVKFTDGEPDKMTQAEKETLSAREITEDGIRLSCQIECDHDLSVELISRLEGSGRKDQGSPVTDEIQPEPVWTEKS